MNWRDFFNTLEPVTDQQGNRLLSRLLALESAPDICWYPGSDCDLVPLLLDVPGNPTGRRLLTTNEDQEEKPLLLWMNDYSEYCKEFPEIELLGNTLNPSYPDLWDEHKATVTIGTSKECYRFGDDMTLTLFTATVKNSRQGSHTRPESGDEYLVCFSNSESEQLLRSVFCAYRLHLHGVMLIKQGGFSCQRYGFSQYKDLPNLVVKCSRVVGKVDCWVIDGYGVKDGKPIAAKLNKLKCVGSTVNWGWEETGVYIAS